MKLNNLFAVLETYESEEDEYDEFDFEFYDDDDDDEYVANLIATSHIAIDKETEVDLIQNGDIIRSASFGSIASYLKTSDDLTGNFIISQDGIELLSVNL